MTTNLTLTVDKTVMDRAKSCTKHTGRSHSVLGKKHLDTLSEEQVDYILSPELKKMARSVKLPKKKCTKKLKSKSKGLEEANQIICVTEAKAAYIATRNVKDF